MLSRAEVLVFTKNGKARNPNLNDVLGGEINELFNHAWLQSSSLKEGGEALVICCEPWDRDLSQAEIKTLLGAIRSREKDFLAMYGGEYLEIENYL